MPPVIEGVARSDCNEQQPETTIPKFVEPGRFHHVGVPFGRRFLTAEDLAGQKTFQSIDIRSVADSLVAEKVKIRNKTKRWNICRVEDTCRFIDERLIIKRAIRVEGVWGEAQRFVNEKIGRGEVSKEKIDRKVFIICGHLNKLTVLIQHRLHLFCGESG